MQHKKTAFVTRDNAAIQITVVVEVRCEVNEFVCRIQNGCSRADHFHLTRLRKNFILLKLSRGERIGQAPMKLNMNWNRRPSDERKIDVILSIQSFREKLWRKFETGRGQNLFGSIYISVAHEQVDVRERAQGWIAINPRGQSGTFQQDNRNVGIGKARKRLRDGGEVHLGPKSRADVSLAQSMQTSPRQQSVRLIE